MLIEWKFKSITDLRTDGHGEVLETIACLKTPKLRFLKKLNHDNTL